MGENKNRVRLNGGEGSWLVGKRLFSRETGCDMGVVSMVGETYVYLDGGTALIIGGRLRSYEVEN